MQMEPSHYLDSEVLKHTNYPEVQGTLPRIAQIDGYLMTANSAIAGYVEGVDSKVYIDIKELETTITLCREVLAELSAAEKPCFDIIVDLRKSLEMLYELLYIRRKYGTEYIDHDTVNIDYIKE